MEPTQKITPPSKPGDEDVDLDQLFYKTGGIVHSFFTGLGRFLSGIGIALLQIIFFFQRNLLWIAVGLAAGLCYGFILSARTGAKFSSSMVVRANFNSSRSLYGAIDQLNALVNNSQKDELSRLLHITPAEAETLLNFEATPVKSEMVTSEMYKNQFLKLERNTKVRMDTFWIKTIDYKTFKSSLSDLDYPVQEITVFSNSPLIFSKLQKGIIDLTSSNELLQEMKSSGEKTNAEAIDLIAASLQSLDTLRAAYNKRLSNQSLESGGNNLTMTEGPALANAPELDLYDKMLELKDELKNAKGQAVLEKNILQVYTPFSSVGEKVSFFKQTSVKYALLGFYLSVFLVIAIGLYKYLKRLERSLANRGK